MYISIDIYGRSYSCPLEADMEWNQFRVRMSMFIPFQKWFSWSFKNLMGDSPNEYGIN